MTKKERILISVGAMTAGWLLFGFAMTSMIRPPVNTISIVLGLGFFVVGLIALVLALKKPTAGEK